MTRRPRRRWIALGLLLLALALSVESPGRSMGEPRDQRVYLVDYGLHTGLVLPRAPFADRGLFADLPPSLWIEIGWGDEQFYRETASIADFDLRTGLRAVLGLGETAIHAVAPPGRPETFFGRDALEAIALDEGGLAAIVAHVEASLSEPAQNLGEGHWRGISAFYRSPLRYAPTRLCNHWTARALNEAGVPVSGVWATLPQTLRWELRLRGGAGGG